MINEERAGFALAIYFRRILHVQDVDLARQRNRPEASQLSIYGRVYIETFCDELIAYSHGNYIASMLPWSDQFEISLRACNLDGNRYILFELLARARCIDRAGHMAPAPVITSSHALRERISTPADIWQISGCSLSLKSSQVMTYDWDLGPQVLSFLKLEGGTGTCDWD